jgi:hypothetical protein
MIWFSVHQETAYVFGPRQVKQGSGVGHTLNASLALGYGHYKSILFPADEEITGS